MGCHLGELSFKKQFPSTGRGKKNLEEQDRKADAVWKQAKLCTISFVLSYLYFEYWKILKMEDDFLKFYWDKFKHIL